MNSIFRLRKHADFQRVYKTGNKQFSRRMTFFFSLRQSGSAGAASARPADLPGPRIGLTVGKVMGKAVDRDRIKRRMRAAVHHSIPALTAPVDVVLHPRRAVIDTPFAELEREVAQVFATIATLLEKPRPARPRTPPTPISTPSPRPTR